MDSKVIKGQAYIVGDSLVQDQTLFLASGAVSENQIVLISNIWDDLKSDKGTYKYNDKKTYFYWEYKQTDPTNDDLEITVKIECPSPKEGLFDPPYTQYKPVGEWENYWIPRLTKIAERYEHEYALQKKEITFPESRYINPNTGEEVVVPETKVDNSDETGDITNLLSMF